ncbi:hypothetical protein ZEAMMB73_Zm00001d036806, partial [Zea mays]
MMQFMLQKTSKKGKKEVTSDDETDSGDKSPQYQESVDSSSMTSSDDAGGGAGNSGGSAGDSGVGASGAGGGAAARSQMALIHFTWESQYKYATQDQDHGAPEELGEVTQQPMRWVYEWEDTQCYQILVESWSTTSAWT